jgi:hypothetical protein
MIANAYKHPDYELVSLLLNDERIQRTLNAVSKRIYEGFVNKQKYS